MLPGPAGHFQMQIVIRRDLIPSHVVKDFHEWRSRIVLFIAQFLVSVRMLESQRLGFLARIAASYRGVSEEYCPSILCFPVIGLSLTCHTSAITTSNM